MARHLTLASRPAIHLLAFVAEMPTLIPARGGDRHEDINWPCGYCVLRMAGIVFIRADRGVEPG